MKIDLTKKSTSKKVIVSFVLDSSGSMGIVRDETIQGVNKYINELKKDSATDYSFSLLTFGKEFTTVYESVPINQVREITKESYIPDGFTPLYDAVGRAIKAVGNVSSDTRVIVVVMTDGHENASTTYNQVTIKELITQKDSLSNWAIIYLGAVADAWDAGGAMGFSLGNTIRYDAGQTMSALDSVAIMTVDTANYSDKEFKVSKKAVWKGKKDL
jgi:uncharacterized protein YegL